MSCEKVLRLSSQIYRSTLESIARAHHRSHQCPSLFVPAPTVQSVLLAADPARARRSFPSSLSSLVAVTQPYFLNAPMP
jgi:hypothetical protein